jgi:hypothetical protein
MKQVRGAAMHPYTQGKIERWRQTLKNHIFLENDFLEGEFEAASPPSSTATGSHVNAVQNPTSMNGGIHTLPR